MILSNNFSLSINLRPLCILTWLSRPRTQTLPAWSSRDAGTGAVGERVMQGWGTPPDVGGFRDDEGPHSPQDQGTNVGSILISRSIWRGNSQKSFPETCLLWKGMPLENSPRILSVVLHNMVTSSFFFQRLVTQEWQEINLKSKKPGHDWHIPVIPARES